MPIPPLRDLITPTSTAASLPAATINERLLLTLAMLATGKAPDGTSLPASGVTLPPVAGYTAWYDASQITGSADNTPLGTWPDLSATGNTLTQATPANRPTYYSSTSGKTVNGKPAVWFVSTGPSYITQTISVPPAQTVFVIGGIGSLADTEAFICGSNNGELEVRSSSGHPHVISCGVANIAQATGTIPSTAPVMVAVTFDGVNGHPVTFYINSGTADSAPAAASTLAAGFLALGYNLQASADALNGPICEIITYPTVLTAPQITSTYTYLKTKWGTP